MKKPQWLAIGVCSLLLLAANSRTSPIAQETGSKVRLDTSGVGSAYANFSRVTGTTEELILDFGLNPRAQGVPNEPIRVNNRVVLSFYTAKRLLGALKMAIDRHEKVFGPIEIDARKRMLKST